MSLVRPRVFLGDLTRNNSASDAELTGYPARNWRRHMNEQQNGEVIDSPFGDSGVKTSLPSLKAATRRRIVRALKDRTVMTDGQISALANVIIGATWTFIADAIKREAQTTFDMMSDATEGSD
jgi:hypothetical protein